MERQSSKTKKLDRKQTKTGWRRVKKDEQDMSKIMRKRSRRKRREENVCVRLCTELVSGWACCTTRWTDRGLPAFPIHFAKRASLSLINYHRNRRAHTPWLAVNNLAIVEFSPVSSFLETVPLCDLDRVPTYDTRSRRDEQKSTELCCTKIRNSRRLIRVVLRNKEME